MKVREAVTKAKDYIRDLYTDEDIRFVGLEEVEFDDESQDHAWRITIGFARPWDSPPKHVLEDALTQTFSGTASLLRDRQSRAPTSLSFCETPTARSWL